MSLLGNIARLIQDPPPEFVFELSESGIAFARGVETGFEPLEPGVLVPSPVEDNLPHSDRAAAALSHILPHGSQSGGGKAGAKAKTKPKRAALILPDHAARVSVLDFDSFPSHTAEQLALVRFRVKKTVPFDVDSAAVSYFAQPVEGSKRHEVVAVTVALEVLARYEALFRNAGFHPGEITTSALAALNLYSQPASGAGAGVLAKLAGRILTVMVISAGRLRLFRCVELSEASDGEIRGVLQPTLAYAEDELGARVERLTVCGFSESPLETLPAEPLRSIRGTAVGPHNAGLLGYLEGRAN